MFEKKFIDFLAQNNIDKDLMILDDKKEEMKFKIAVSNNTIVNTKTLMPVKKRSIELKNGDFVVYLKQNNSIADNIFLDDICFKFPDSIINIHVCENCDLSSMSLCIYNSMYKYSCILVKKDGMK